VSETVPVSLAAVAPPPALPFTGRPGALAQTSAQGQVRPTSLRPWLAVNTFWSVVLGGALAIIGGIAGPMLLQQHNDNRADRLTAEHTRGAARMLFTELMESTNEMVVLENDRKVHPMPKAYLIDIPPEDMTLIAAKLPGDLWAQVAAAQTNIQGLDTMMTTLTSEGRDRLTRREACLIHVDVVSTRYAAAALAMLAGPPTSTYQPSIKSLIKCPK
jgi:hypothetical protein